MTECVNPPPIGELELLHHLDGGATEGTRDHLLKCEYCNDRFRMLANMERQLSSRLGRAACPSPHELGEFHLRMLPFSRAEEIRGHLTLCPHCPAELAQLEGFLGELSPKVLPAKANPFRALTASLLASGPQAGSSSPKLAPSWAATRGPGENARIYQAEELQIALDVLPDADHPEARVLIGLLLGVHPAGWRAYLWEGDRPVAETAVDDIGNFQFSRVPAAGYDLVMRGPQAEVTLPSLDI